MKNVARVWAYETACALGIEKDIDPNLPWNEYFEWFGPRYRLEVVASNMEDMNVKDGSLDKVRVKALEQLRDLQPVPSVGLQDTPRESLGAHLGFGKDDQEKRDQLDELLARMYCFYLYEEILINLFRRAYSLCIQPPRIRYRIIVVFRRRRRTIRFRRVLLLPRQQTRFAFAK